VGIFCVHGSEIPLGTLQRHNNHSCLWLGEDVPILLHEVAFLGPILILIPLRDVYRLAAHLVEGFMSFSLVALYCSLGQRLNCGSIFHIRRGAAELGAGRFAGRSGRGDQERLGARHT
jgi:hypothetical protein